MSDIRKRSEDDIISMTGLTAVLGDKTYKIPVLRIGKAREWRAKYDAAMAPITTSFSGTSSPGSGISSGLTAALLQFPETIADLVFEYAGDVLDREVILNEATEEQLTKVFADIMAVAYPFLAQLGTVVQVLRQTASSLR